MTPPLFAAAHHVIDAVVKEFNGVAHDLGYGRDTVACLPVKIADLTEVPVIGGGSPLPVDECRSLCMYVIAQHVLVEDQFAGRHRMMTYSAVGTHFSRGEGQVRKCLRTACVMLAKDQYAKVYDAALQRIASEGLELWNTPQRSICR